jgi:Mpv17 / PMP22 family
MGHIASAPIKTFLDQAIHHPFIYFPSFYLLKYTLVQGDPPETAFKRWGDELWPNCRALWTIWVPAQVRATLCLPPLRLLCEHACGMPHTSTASQRCEHCTPSAGLQQVPLLTI